MKALRIRHRFELDMEAMRAQLGSSYEAETLFFCVELLVDGRPLPGAMRDHPLREDMAGLRDFHLDGDWVVIYSTTDSEVVLHRTGRHVDVFTKRLPKRDR